MKKLKYIMPIAIILRICIYISTSPIGAIRLAVLEFGYPKSAITLKLSDEPCRPPIEIDRIGDEKVYTIINYPIEERTQTPFESWVVFKYGPFYWAKVYTV